MKQTTLILLCSVFSIACFSQDVNLFFDFNSDKLRQNDIAKLDEIISLYKQDSIRLIIKGYADSTGKNSYNLDLSKRRAITARDYLVKQKVDPRSLDVEYYGETGKITVNPVLNRKVEIIIINSKRASIRNYDEFLRGITPLEEVFEIPTNIPSSIECKKGTVVTIPPNAFRYLSGETVEGPVKLSVSEYYSISDLISKRLSTVSGGNLLVSEGVVNIKALKDSTEIFLKDGREIGVDFPKTSNDRYYTFYGVSQPDGRMDWELDEVLWKQRQTEVGVTLAEEGHSLVVVDRTVADRRNNSLVYDRSLKKMRVMTSTDRRAFDSIKAHELDSLHAISLVNQQNMENQQKYYTALSTRRLNWINCDLFLRDPSSGIIDYYVNVENPGVQVLNVYLVFTRIKSVVELSRKNANNFHIYARLPLKQPVRLLVSGTANGKFYMYFRDAEPGDQKTETIELEESTLDEFSVLLKKL